MEAAEEELAMCGIVGAAARRNIVPVLVEGLKRLEYRGYDSAGIAVVNDASIKRVRAAGRVAELATQTTKEQVGGFYLVDAADLDEAIELAAAIPGAKNGTIEVRPIWEM